MFWVAATVQLANRRRRLCDLLPEWQPLLALEGHLQDAEVVEDLDVTCIRPTQIVD